MEYKVTITELLCMDVYVEADCMEDAEKAVKEAYINGDYVLDADHYVDTQFETQEV